MVNLGDAVKIWRDLNKKAKGKKRLYWRKFSIMKRYYLIDESYNEQMSKLNTAEFMQRQTMASDIESNLR